MKKIKILIADDHSVVREGLRALLGKVADFDVVAESADGEEAVRLTRERKPDVAIVDISMPKLNGVEATRRIREQSPDTKVLIFTIHENEEYVYQMVASGANGYVLKDAGKNDLIAAVRSIHTGGRFFSPGVSRLIIDEFVRRSRANGTGAAAGKSPLTHRESEILQYIASGFTNAEIAGKLFLSVRTVNTHRTNLMQKLDVHNTAGLVRYAMENGIVSSGA
ncbi:MAG TPA: response regulator transcription factor [Bacteroidota bacterium]|nr:response regulator transcription factor [Bacteroidota bacterium]